MKTYLVVNQVTNEVTNAIVWDGGSSINIPDSTLVAIPDEPLGVWLGWKLIDGVWTAPRETDNGY